MFRNSISDAVPPAIHAIRGSGKPGSNSPATNASELLAHEPKTPAATWQFAAMTTRPPARMTSEAMEKTLRSRNISLHQAHVFNIGIPEIMSLASAYATDRITREVFIQTLNLFVRHASAARGESRALTAAHFVSLGISQKDAERLPLAQPGRDVWIIAGLFNDVMEMEDFEQLQNPDRKGEFWESNFGNRMKRKERGTLLPSDDDDGYISWKILAYIGEADDDDDPKFEIEPACKTLEKGLPRYNAKIHYALRLEGAARKGQRPNLLGPYYFEDAMKKMFYSIFRIVDPDYKGSTLDELDAFDFSEPPPSPPSQPTPIPKRLTSSKSSNRDCGLRSFCALV